MREPAEVLRRLELTVTRRLDGLLQGDYRGLMPGHGSEPGEAREYLPGDDVRRIDWNVTARLQSTHVRDSIADRELETWMLIDQSASLDFGTAAYEKRDLAVEAAGAVGFVTARGGNRLGAVLLRAGSGPVTVPPRSGRTHLLALLHNVLSGPRADGNGPTDLAKGLERVGSMMKRRGLAVVISDFLTDLSWELPLRRLSVRHEVLAIEVLDPREMELPDVGVLQLIDPETGASREVQTGDAALRTRYAAAAVAQRDAIAAALRRSGAAHLQLRTDRDWLRDLVAFMALRRRLATGAPAPAVRTP